MTLRGALRFGISLLALLVVAVPVRPGRLAAAGSIPSPEQFIGFRVGADNKLARWDKMLEYFRAVAGTSDRVHLRELGKTGGGNPFVVLEITAPETFKSLDRYRQLERQLYFQDGPPSARDRDEIFRRGKVVVAVTCSVHANEVGATQMSLALVHQLATDDSPAVKKILDNVIFLLVPSANPDGQILVTDWFNRNVGTPYESSPLPYLYHPYAGHDINRDMYMFTQRESQYTAQLMWHDWFPSIWLDEHQMGQGGPRIFVMPAGDPINPNVHPLIYRWNGILGQSQAAALEAAGKDGIIYNATYTNFWEGAMAWSGWWHNQIGLLTEVASARVAAPVDQQRVAAGRPLSVNPPRVVPNGGTFESGLLPAPLDVTPRTEYPRPWLGGHWTLGDIVDYNLIATMGLLETAADRRETILRQVYEANRQTVEAGKIGDVAAVVIPIDGQHDLREAAHLVDRLQVGGVDVYRSEGAFEAGGRAYAAGSFVIPMTQVFARYAKDLLEPQVYPEVRPSASLTADADAPYDVTAWSLGMLLNVNVDFLENRLPASVRLTRMRGVPTVVGSTTGSGPKFTFAYQGADTAIAINRLLREGARVSFDRPSQVAVTGTTRDKVDALAKAYGLTVTAGPASEGAEPGLILHPPRIALYSPWTGGNIDEGWTRWVLEQYDFAPTTVHNADLRMGGLRERFDVIVLADQIPREIIDGLNAAPIRTEFRGGIGEAGVENLQRFVTDGGTLVALGAATDLLIDRWPIAVRDLKRTLRREQHYGPGTILRLRVDSSQPLGYGMPTATFGFYDNSPFFSVTEATSPTPQHSTIVARYPTTDVVASGWLSGEELMAGRAAVVSVDMNPGRLVLFGLRTQHRAQTHATFPLLFNALYMSATEGTVPGHTQ